MVTKSKQSIKLTRPTQSRQTRQSHFFCLVALLLCLLSPPVRAEAESELLPCELLPKNLKYASWFPIDQEMKYEQVILLAPGLNLNPLRLHSLASALVKLKSKVLLLDIDSSAPLLIRLHHSLCAAAATAKTLGPEVKLFALGHSLGALALLDLKTRTYHQKLDGLILIAPSLFPRLYTRALKLIDWLPYGGLPSFNFKDYRLRDSTSFKSYRELRAIREHFFGHQERISHFGPTLLFMSPSDELLDFEATQKFAKENHLIFHKLIPQSNLGRTIDHLLIDPPSMGASLFEQMVQEIGNFLAKE